MSPGAKDDGTVEVEIDGIASSGAGVGRLPDGRAVFVHRTAPGDRARIRVTEEKKRWARGRLTEVLEGAPERRDAPCPHYDRCGGCTLEHLSYATQLDWKGRIVADAMERIGGIEVDTPAVRPSPKKTRYRARVSVTLRRVGDERIVAGFHQIDRPEKLVDLGGECLLFDPELAAVWDRLREEWGPDAARLPAGDELRLTLRRVREGALLVVDGGRGRGEPAELVRRVEGLVAVWRKDEKGVRRVAGEEEATVERLGEVIRVRGTAFLQVNREAAEAVQHHVLDRIGAPEGSVVDAYCGVAILGRILARRGVEVTGIELDPDAVEGARAGAPQGLEILPGAVEKRLPEALPADVVLLNPPRAGLHERVPRVLLEARPRRLVYVSCDAATLARDADRLASGYTLEELEAFDLFPQTAHVESVAVFRARDEG